VNCSHDVISYLGTKPSRPSLWGNTWKAFPVERRWIWLYTRC